MSPKFYTIPFHHFFYSQDYLYRLLYAEEEGLRGFAIARHLFQEAIYGMAIDAFRSLLKKGSTSPVIKG